MHIGRRVGVAGTVLALTLTVTNSATAAPPAAPGSPAGAARSTTVTLITGDRVIIPATAGAPVTIRAAKGREGMTFASYNAAGHRYVIPADALRPLRTGQLDRRLFDVTLLAESGYDDASRATLPLIVTYQPGAARAGAAGARDLPSINGTALAADKANATALWNTVTTGAPAARTAAAGVRKVWLDGLRKSTLDRSVPQINAPAAWAAGFTGTGVKIAVLDSGVDQTHPDLAGRQAAERNFSDAADNVDRAGHGTHVASIAAGTGAKADGRYKGVAFGATILDGKVLNDGGFGLDSWIIAGMEWAAAEGAKVANLSLGGTDSPEIDPVEEAVNTLSEQHGILFVIAAGNSGRPQTVASPGSADAALTVGAVDRDNEIAFFSSRGPRTGDGAIKPDITAPGVEIVAAKAAEGFLGNPAGDGYVSMSGTSMATPHVAGSAALLAQQHPDWTGAQIKAALTASAAPTAGASAFDQGSGRVDMAKAITQTVVTQPTSVSLGTVQWPHDDDQPVTKPLSYRNTGAAAVTLDLAVEATGPDGQPAPAGMFAISANQITVPAGGEAQVSVTGNTRVGSKDGGYTGAIRATSGNTVVRTPIAVDREVESYNVTFNVKGFDGALTPGYDILLVGLDSPTVAFPYDADGSATIRLPKGRYVADTIVIAENEGTLERLAHLPYPALSVTGETTVDLDARTGRPVSITPPDPAATLAVAGIGYDVISEQGGFGVTFILGDLDVYSIAHIGPALPREQLTASINTQWSNAGGEFFGLAEFRFGTVPTGFTKVYRPRDVATVKAEFGAGSPGRSGLRFAFPAPANAPSMGGVAVLMDVTLPGSRTEYYNADGVRWQTGLWQVDLENFVIEYEALSEFKQFRAGRTVTERFLNAPFGPAFPRSEFPWAARGGDFIGVTVPLFSDASGNSGSSVVESGSTKLFRNGELVGEVPEAGRGGFDVPPEVANYRVTTEAVRSAALFDVSRRVSASWTFRSGHVDGDTPAPLPLSAVRFTPRLDATNSAPAGTAFLVPVAVQQQNGSLVRAQRLTVDVSYDEGRTWRRAEVVLGLAVLLHHPAGAKSVSLRAMATDRHGNTVDQTIINAYKLVKK
ncbi:MAG TPA: S8 family peptidase [Actinophytocola sp.]|uniref:S8 family peptidase n=1 Tax=Actinophytocola sp. TaxID=1872138 RepID=UPI002DBC54FE|nr:S8 family peptidase [Actinophytocola sp.]HEU5469865.1 S8 family peptidase [Actinophytocola sp.]